MALTKSFRETVVERTKADPEFRKGLLYHAVELMLSGDLEAGKRTLRNYINATVGFVALAAELRLSPKGIQRMFGKTGNPQANNLFRIVAYLQAVEGVELKVTAQPRPPASKKSLKRSGETIDYGTSASHAARSQIATALAPGSGCPSTRSPR